MLKTNLVGIIGQSIQYSLSPIIHEYWMKKNQIEGAYKIFDLQEEELIPFLKNIHTLKIKGLNVTIPYKSKILNLIDEISEEAAIMGAVNTLTIKKNGEIFGDNTDPIGFMNNLKNNCPNWNKQYNPIVVIGAGGASRAVIYSLLTHKIKEIRILNRNEKRANDLILNMKNIFPKANIYLYDNYDKALEGSCFLINTSSLGMTGHPNLNINLKYMNKNSIVYDIVYSPLETNLLKQAKKLNYITIDGLGMLLEQAAPAFNSWFNKKVTVTSDLKSKVIQIIKDKK